MGAYRGPKDLMPVAWTDPIAYERETKDQRPAPEEEDLDPASPKPRPQFRLDRDMNPRKK